MKKSPFSFFSVNGSFELANTLDLPSYVIAILLLLLSRHSGCLFCISRSNDVVTLESSDADTSVVEEEPIK